MNDLHSWFREKYPMHSGALLLNFGCTVDYDVVLSIKNNKYNGLYIDVVKSGKNYSQAAVHALFSLRRAGYKTEVCASDGAVKHVIAEYLGFIGKAD